MSGVRAIPPEAVVVPVMVDQTEIEQLKARRVTALFRLDLIGKGARITYDDGTPVDMKSEQDRLEAMVAELDRRIARLEATIH